MEIKLRPSGRPAGKNKERNEQIARRYIAGETPATIAADLDIGIKRVQGILREMAKKAASPQPDQQQQQQQEE